MTRFPRSASEPRRPGGGASAVRSAALVAALGAVLFLAAPAGTLAAWEPAQPIDGEGFGDAGVVTSQESVGLAVGGNGLATALFFQADRDQAFFARRPAGASSWAAPQGTALPAERSAFPSKAKLAANDEGDALGTWERARQIEGADWPVDAPNPAAVSEVMEATSPSDLAVDAQGNGYAVARGPQGDLLFARFDPATGAWSAPEQINDISSGAPQIAVNGAGEIAIAYVKPVGAGVDFEQRLFGRRWLSGESGFSSEQALDAPSDSVSFDSGLAIDDDGAITVVFTEPSGFGRAFATRWLPGVDAADPELISTPRPAYPPASAPKVVVDSEGRVTAAWRQLEGDAVTRLYAAERVDDQGFGHPERVSPANEHLTDDESDQPPEDGPSPENERSVASYDLAVDAQGTATIVYGDSLVSGLADDADVKAARRATGGRWTAPLSLHSTGPRAGAVDRFNVRVAAAKAGQVDAIFVQEIDGRRTLLGTRFEGPPPPGGEHQTIVSSFDGTEIFVNWCPAAELDAEGRAPTVMVGPGWGIAGTRCPPGGDPEDTGEGAFGITPIRAFTEAGYNVLTFDPRGFWRSGGTVMVDSPEFEGRDAQVLIDYIATQPEALLDGPGDPRLGMSGGSYGGGIQLVTAALDDRVDAIAPSIAWSSLITSLFKRDAVKAGWASILFGAGVPTSTLPGVLSPAGIQTGHLAPELYETLAQAAASGTISPELKEFYAERGPDFLLDRIEAPTLLLQGTVDTLFTLDEAHQSFETLSAAGTPVKMLWFCGGHGVCLTEAGETEYVDQRVLAWFDHYLRGRDVPTGPEFEWIDEDGVWHPSDRYPLDLAGELRGEGSGILPLAPGEQPGSGVAIAASPSPLSVEVPIEIPPEDSTVLGEPILRLTYSATGTATIGAGTESGPQQRTYVYAQIVDESRNIVVNNVATPIPIALDGEEHQLSLALEQIASRSTSAGYSLQIVQQTSVYDGQRATGEVEFRSIEITLPVELAEASPGDGDGDGVPDDQDGCPTEAGPESNDGCPLESSPDDDDGGDGPGEPGSGGSGGAGGPGGSSDGAGGSVGGPGGDDGQVDGGPCSNLIRGTKRADRLEGTSGSDRIAGKRGRDRLNGKGGDDCVRGGAGRDRLRGGSGDDLIAGGRGRDRIKAGPGDDLIRVARGRADRVDCGPGDDRVIVGRGDSVRRCERVRRRYG